MKTEADSEGSYLLADPPVGEYEVVPVWPEGVTDGAPLAPGAPVTVAAGQEVAGIDVYLAKRLPVLEPAIGAEVRATPTLRWEAVPNVRPLSGDHHRLCHDGGLLRRGHHGYQCGPGHAAAGGPKAYPGYQRAGRSDEPAGG